MHQQLRQSTNRALKEFAKRSSIWSRFLQEFDSLSCIRLAVSGFVVLSSLLYCSASNAPRAEQTVSISSTAAGNSGTGVTEGRPFNFNVSVPLATDMELTVAYTVATSNSSAISGLSNGNVTIKAGESSGTGTIAMATTSS